jgi:hypothetical protein
MATRGCTSRSASNVAQVPPRIMNRDLALAALMVPGGAGGSGLTRPDEAKVRPRSRGWGRRGPAIATVAVGRPIIAVTTEDCLKVYTGVG